jgi:acetoin utilization protein AcuB
MSSINPQEGLACVPNTVASIMTRHVISVSLDATLRAVRQLFELHRIHHVPVLERGVLVGIVSDRDLLRALSPAVDTPAASARDLATLDKHVHQIMHRGTVTVGPLVTIAEAGQIMLAQRISALPVVEGAGENARCVGIITSRDFMKWCLQSGCPTAKAA